jgi:hypothetical protein
MLCSLCQHGTTSKIGGKPTGNVWPCECGESNCRHIRVCKCGLAKPQRPALGDYLALGNECHTVINNAMHLAAPNVWLVTDHCGVDYRVTRDPDNDNELRYAWRLA